MSQEEHSSEELPPAASYTSPAHGEVGEDYQRLDSAGTIKVTKTKIYIDKDGLGILIGKLGL